VQAKKQKMQSVLSQIQSYALSGRVQRCKNLRHQQTQELAKILNLCYTQNTQFQNNLTSISQICNGHSWNTQTLYTQAWDNQAQNIPFHHHCRERQLQILPLLKYPEGPGTLAQRASHSGLLLVCPFPLGLVTPPSSAKMSTGEDFESNTREGSKGQGGEWTGESSGDAKWRRGRREGDQKLRLRRERQGATETALGRGQTPQRRGRGQAVCSPREGLPPQLALQWRRQLCLPKHHNQDLRLLLGLSADGHDDLANMNPGHCALGLPKGTTHTCLEPVSPSTGQHLVDSEDMKRVKPHSNMKAILATLFTMYLLAQIRAASRASEESCSYSSDTMWSQSGNSSTFAFFCPKSKMRILASGTPRQKRDFGYGLFLQYR
ncbi:hypothetical protein U0070_024982, partial [Myodes glareolus]